jgi:thymidylate kinase
MSYPIIVIEGLDGVGKSTLVKNLSLKINAVVLKTPPFVYSPMICDESLRPFFDAQPEPIRRAYYRFSCVIAGVKARELSKKQPVIIDRYWTSTVAYAFGAGEAHEILRHAGVYPDDIVRPDHTILLTVSEQVRLKRIRKRQDTDTVEEQRLAADMTFRKRTLSAFRWFDIHEIDTSHLTPDDVLVSALEAIRGAT